MMQGYSNQEYTLINSRFDEKNNIVMIGQTNEKIGNIPNRKYMNETYKDKDSDKECHAKNKTSLNNFLDTCNVLDNLIIIATTNNENIEDKNSYLYELDPFPLPDLQYYVFDLRSS